MTKRVTAMNRRCKIPERFRCPKSSQHRHIPESNLIVRHPQQEEPQKRHRNAETGKSGTDTHKDTETGHSGHENNESEVFSSE